MNSSKLSLTAAAILGLAAIPAGYGLRSVLTQSFSTPEMSKASSNASRETAPTRLALAIPPSQVADEWKRLQERFGTGPDAMPLMFRNVSQREDGFLKEALFSALIAEWVEVDPHGGLAFFREKKTNERKPFLEEWARCDPAAAYAGMGTSGKGWWRLLGDAALVLAQQAPDLVIANLAKIPLDQDHRSKETTLRLLAEAGYLALRDAAADLDKRWANPALAAAIREWAKHDGPAALRWAQDHPDEKRGELQVEAFGGWASADLGPVAK
jgi:hypothetical protein